MAGGLVALLDDVAALARAAAASIDDVGAAAARASVKATGVVVDDTAVTPRYVQGLDPKRELPIIKKIAKGSIRNKLLFILPAIMLLSQFLPWLLMPVLMVGGAYLSYEGAEKLWEALRGGHEEESNADKSEAEITGGAIRTDFILSAEIMVISLKEVEDEPFLSRLAILIVVALLITVLVYGVVALIVKMDDVGLHLTQKPGRGAQRLGSTLVHGMPKVLSVLSTVGIAAMLWVGGHILLIGLDDVGWHWPYAQVHHLEESVHDATGALGSVLGWLTNTLGSALVGLVVGAVIVAALHVIPRRNSKVAEGAAH
ncbi:DUF808 domain-containing protein [Luteipulveratus mongoliensis]|uniref:ABC transporter n=1 Tax=Luteipulveratus mongoliensis TaxID=571913 RepID=A0A0K1JI26_9MICO|nr:DUF808 domain-containing protein [Luteipulveratus mongoliensis]AKU16230.1 ABC transporter [Luteipulveratus mongoliensis]